MLLARPCIPVGMNISEIKYREGRCCQVVTSSGETGLPQCLSRVR